MLKGRKSLYIFLPLNIFLWGYIGYKLYISFGGEDETLPDELPVAVSHVKDKDSADYQLSLDYADPFLKNTLVRTTPVRKTINTETAKPKVAQVKAIAVPAKATEIKYLGLVHNKSSGVKTALVSINGQPHIIKSGETVSGIALQQIDKDFIVVKEGKEKITISR